MMKQGPAYIASRLLKAWTTGDFETARGLLADDVEFVGPLGTTRGADAYIDGVRGMKQLVDRADERTEISEGDDVCIVYDLVTTKASIPTAAWYRVVNGKVAFVRAYFDPRPLA